MRIESLRLRRIGTEHDPLATVVLEVGLTDGGFVEVMSEPVESCFDHVISMKRVLEMIELAGQAQTPEIE